MLHNTTLRFAYMDFFQHYLGYLVFGESVFINRFISDIWLFWLYGSLGRTKHVAHISGTQCILNRDIFGSGSVTNSFYSWSYPVGVWQQGGPTWNLSAGLLKCFYSVKFQEGFQRMNRPSIPDCKKGQKCKSNFPDRVSYSNHFWTKFRPDSWRNVQGTVAEHGLSFISEVWWLWILELPLWERVNLRQTWHQFLFPPSQLNAAAAKECHRWRRRGRQARP